MRCECEITSEEGGGRARGGRTLAMSSSERRPPKAGMAFLPLVTCFTTDASLTPPSRYSVSASSCGRGEARGSGGRASPQWDGLRAIRARAAAWGGGAFGGLERVAERRPRALRWRPWARQACARERYLQRFLRHDDVLAARVARSAVAREDLLARAGVASERRQRACSEHSRREDRQGSALDVQVELGHRGVEGEGRDSDGEPAQACGKVAGEQRRRCNRQ